MIVAAVTTLLVPWIIRDIVDDVLTAKNMTALNLIAVAILLIFFVRGIFTFGHGYLMSNAPELLKKHLPRHTTDRDHDGIAEALAAHGIC